MKPRKSKVVTVKIALRPGYSTLYDGTVYVHGEEVWHALGGGSMRTIKELCAEHADLAWERYMRDRT